MPSDNRIIDIDKLNWYDFSDELPMLNYPIWVFYSNLSGTGGAFFSDEGILINETTVQLSKDPKTRLPVFSTKTQVNLPSIAKYWAYKYIRWVEFSEELPMLNRRIGVRWVNVAYGLAAFYDIGKLINNKTVELLDYKMSNGENKQLPIHRPEECASYEDLWAYM